MDEDAEKTLIERCLRDDPAALNELWMEVEPSVRNAILSVLGDKNRTVEGQGFDDIAQDTWLAIQRSLPTYEPRNRLGAWAAKIAKRRTIDLVRRTSGHRIQTSGPGTAEKDDDWKEQLTLQLLASVGSQGQLLGRRELIQLAGKALSTLSTEEQYLIRERCQHERTEREIAPTLGVHPSNVNRRYHAILDKLRREVGEFMSSRPGTDLGVRQPW